MKRVLITGGTGLIGKFLQEVLLKDGYEVVILSRAKKKSSLQGLSYALWNVDDSKIDVDTVCEVDHIVHLAGANIADKRWSDKQKQTIIDSRVKTANLIFETLKQNKHQVKSFISASGSDYYGLATSNRNYQEEDEVGADFLANVCDVWEKAANQFDQIGVRTVCLRTGVVFAKKDSALQKMVLPVRLGLGSAIGTGKQIMSLIHVKDLCMAYKHVIENVNLTGAYNAVAINKTNKEVTKEMAIVLKKPFFMPKVPAFVLKLMFGEMSIILLKGNAVNNAKLKSTSFVFEYPTLTKILEDTV